MSKSIYTIGIGLSVIFFLVCGYYFIEAEKATVIMYGNYTYLEQASRDYGFELGPGRDELSTQVGLLSLLFLGYFIFMNITGLRKVKTKSMKTSSIIALSLTGIILLWNFAMLSSPGAMSFDEIGMAWLGYCVVMFIIAIIGFGQSSKYNKIKGSEQAPFNIEDTSELLDS
ncbi:MAG: hypothetical protein HRT57_03495 [Crocinitomicaceae bacterium]|nr:hypothetical protein [Crocinitomicaceae bacterium]